MKIFFNFLSLSFFVFTLLLVDTAAAQRFVVDLEDPNFVPYPMAVPDVVEMKGMETQEGLGLKLGDILRNDLEISGIFSVINKAAYLAPKTEPWTNPEYPSWVKVGASGLIRGAYSLNKDNLKITFRLYDVMAQREILLKHYEGRLKEHRALVHKFADDLYQFFTGKRSIFSTKIAFVAAAPNGQGRAVYICDFDGANAEAVLANGKLNLMPSWSNDGKELFVTSYVNDKPDLYRYNLATKKLTLLSGAKGLNMGANLSPNGQKVVFTMSKDGNREIYSIGSDGKGLTRLTNHWGEDVSPHWNHDGTQIVFVSSRSGNPQLYAMKPDGSDVRRLTFQGNYNTEPDWSPVPGGQIVFSARDELNMFDIFMVNPENNVITRLTQDEGHNNEAPSFSPDGRHIVFTSNRSGRGRNLYIMRLDGSGQRLISSKAGDIDSPAWSPILN